MPKQLRESALILACAALMGIAQAAIKNDGNWTYAMPLGNLSAIWYIPPLLIGGVFRGRLLSAIALGITSCMTMMAGFYAEYEREGFVTSALYSDITRYFILSVVLGSTVSAISSLVGNRAYVRYALLGVFFVGEKFAWQHANLAPLLHFHSLVSTGRHHEVWQSVFHVEMMCGIGLLVIAGLKRLRPSIHRQPNL